MKRIFIVILVSFCFIPTMLAWALGINDILFLKELGFTEQEIQQEIEKNGLSHTPTSAELQKLKDAGFSQEFIKKINNKNKTQKNALTEQEFLSLIDNGASIKDILKAISTRGQSLVGNQNLAKKLDEKAVAYPIFLAIKGEPISKQELFRLAEFGLKKESYNILIDIVGLKREKLSPLEALQLVKAGVPREVVQLLKKEKADIQPSSPEIKEHKKVLSEKIELKNGSFTHISKRFHIKCPEGWNLFRKIEEGNVEYYVTPENFSTLSKEPDIFFVIWLMPRPKDAEKWINSPVEILQQGLKEELREEPGLKVVSEAVKRKIGDLDGASLAFEGTLKDKVGKFKGEFYAALDEDMVYLLGTLSPEKLYKKYTKDFQYILSNIQLGRHQSSFRGKALDASDLVKKYKKSVVVVYANTGLSGGQGTGFIVSKDGYILTNWHVIWDHEHQKPHEEFYVYWDDSLKLPRKKAKLIGYANRRRSQVFFGGIDMALLKIEPGDYTPIPLTPVKDVELGDEIITLGYPRSDIVAGYSLFVTKGVVVRFNRDLLGNIESFSIDAKITHGNSGGPCISLKTGGAIGLTTGGVDISTGGNGGESLNDMVGYYFVLTSENAAKQFPLILELGIRDSDRLNFFDYYELSQLYLTPATAHAALKFADKALALQKNEYTLTQKAMALVSVGMESLAENPSEGSKKINEAVELLKEALKLNPTYEAAFGYLVQLLLALDKTDEAEQYAQKYVTLSPNDWNAHMQLAMIYLAKNQKEKAKKELNQAINLAKDLAAEPYVSAGLLAYDENRLEEGRRLLQKASEIMPTAIDARIGVVAYYELKNNWEKALKGYEQLLADFPRNPLIFYKIGMCYNKLNNNEKALYYYHESLSSFKKRGIIPPADLLLNMGDVCQKTFNNPEIAIKFYTMFLLYYWQDENAIKVHAKIAASINNQGVASAHVRAAYALAKRLNKTFKAENFQYKDLSIKDIMYMLSLNYPPNVVANLILNTRLDFQIKDKNDVDQLIEKYKLPFVVIRAILEVNKLQEDEAQEQPMPPSPTQPPVNEPPDWQPPAQPQPFPDAPPPPTPNQTDSSWLVGQWSGSVMLPGIGYYQENLTFMPDGSFFAQVMSPYGSYVVQGMWNIEGNMLHLITSQGEELKRMFKKIGPYTISLFIEEGQTWMTFTKIQ